MAVIHPPESQYSMELWKFEHHEGEAHPSNPSIRGLRPRPGEFRQFPAMLAKATQKNPWKFEEIYVTTEAEQRNYEGLGFVAGGHGAAAAKFDALQQDMAVAAAHRNYDDRNMSERAKAHSSDVEQASSQHLGEIPRTPVKPRKPGRPKKADPVTQ